MVLTDRVRPLLSADLVVPVNTRADLDPVVRAGQVAHVNRGGQAKVRPTSKVAPVVRADLMVVAKVRASRPSAIKTRICPCARKSSRAKA